LVHAIEEGAIVGICLAAVMAIPDEQADDEDSRRGQFSHYEDMSPIHMLLLFALLVHTLTGKDLPEHRERHGEIEANPPLEKS
jgi:hypothetical protein